MTDWRSDDDLAMQRARVHERELREAQWRHPVTPKPYDQDQDDDRSITSAKTIGLLTMVGVGWSVWAYEHHPNIRLLRLNAAGEARGGLIVEITTRSTVDDDTGEITTERAFRTLDPYACPQLKWTTLLESQVDPERVEGPETRRRWVCIIALLTHAIRAGKPLDLARTEHERTDLIGDAWRIARAGMP